MEREYEWDRQRERERKPQAGSMLSLKHNMGLNLVTPDQDLSRNQNSDT